MTMSKLVIPDIFMVLFLFFFFFGIFFHVSSFETSGNGQAMTIFRSTCQIHPSEKLNLQSLKETVIFKAN